MIEFVVFDLDGTIADTLRDLGTAVNAALQSEGLPTYPIEDYRRLVGNGVDRLMRDAMADAYTPEGAERMKAAFRAYYTDHCLDYTTAYDGVGVLLQQLSRDGVATAVISNKPHQFVPEILKKLYPEHEFMLAWGQREGVARKPDPEALIKAIERGGFDRSRTLYVGDSDVDVKFARNAGVKVCGVSWGFRGADELREAGADHIVDTPLEIIEIITSS